MAEKSQKKTQSKDLSREVKETSVNVAGIATEVIEHEQRLDELENTVAKLKQRLGL